MSELNSDVPARFAAARRRHVQSRFLPRFQDQIGKHLPTLDLQSSLMDLEASKRFDRELQARLADLRSRGELDIVVTRDSERLGVEARRIFADAPREGLWVLFHHWQQIGALQLNSRQLQEKTLALLEWDGDTVYGGTRSLSWVFLFDRREELDGVVFEAAFTASGG